MKNLKIISRREAMNRLTNSVFVSGGTLSPFPLSREKYDWYGERAYIGQVLSVNNEVDCVYVEKQQDYENGVFCVFMCMMKSRITRNHSTPLID